MNKPQAHWLLLVAVVVIGTLVMRACRAEGFNNRDGWSSETNGVKYFHGNDGSYGWQTEGGGGSYYHGSDRSCFTNSVTGINYTHCHEWK